MLCISFTTNFRQVFVLGMEKLIKEATTKEKSTLEGVRRKVVWSSVIINAALFSDILAPVKDLSIALQYNLQLTDTLKGGQL